MNRGILTGNAAVGKEHVAGLGRSSFRTLARPKALSLSQTGHSHGRGHSHAFEGDAGSDERGRAGSMEESNVSRTTLGSVGKDASNVRRQGESCEWPRACAWPMRERRNASEIAQSAISDAAAAASLSNSIDWTPEAKVYTMNEEVDADLPPDVELLAYFSDSPIAWRAHEHYSEDDELDESGPRSAWRKALSKWFSKMWRYQGLG